MGVAPSLDEQANEHSENSEEEMRAPSTLIAELQRGFNEFSQALDHHEEKEDGIEPTRNVRKSQKSKKKAAVKPIAPISPSNLVVCKSPTRPSGPPRILWNVRRTPACRLAMREMFDTSYVDDGYAAALVHRAEWATALPFYLSSVAHFTTSHFWHRIDSGFSSDQFFLGHPKLLREPVCSLLQAFVKLSRPRDEYRNVVIFELDTHCLAAFHSVDIPEAVEHMLEEGFLVLIYVISESSKRDFFPG